MTPLADTFTRSGARVLVQHDPEHLERVRQARRMLFQFGRDGIELRRRAA